MSTPLIVNGRPLGELRVIDLKEELDKRGLSKTGNKSALVKRLEESLLAEADSTSAEAQPEIEQPEPATDTFSSPNIAMKETGNDLVAEYLRNQQEALQAAKKAQEQAMAGSSDSESGTPAPADDSTPGRTEDGVETRAAAGGSRESSPGSTRSSSPPSDKETAGKEDEGVAGSRPRPQEDQEEQEEEEDGEDSRENPVEVGSGSLPDDEVEIAAPPESVEEMIADQQTTKVEEASSLENDEDNTKTDSVEPAKEKPPRKRKWGSTRIGKRETVAISSDSLKDIVGSVKEVVEETLPEHKVELDYDEEQPPEPKRIVLSQDAEKEEEEEEESVRRETPPPSIKRIVVEEPSEQVIINKEPISHESVTEEGMRRCKSVTPARYEVSEVIHVRCLTRPFTMQGLKDLLGQFGTFDDTKGFWIDHIKSNCVVKYERKEEAEKARNGLHNVKWPPGNPKQLRVDYATEDVLERHLKGISGDRREKRQDPEPVKKEPMVREEGKRSRSGDRGRRRSSRTPPHPLPKTREWDREKNWGRGQSPPREERKKRSPPVQERERNGGLEGEGKPAKLLDDLFRKTKTTPCIYWLPLTEEQIRERALEKTRVAEERAERLRRLEEEEERFSRRRDFPPPPRRRSPTPERFRRR